MKKVLSLPVILVLLMLCGCDAVQENTDTRLQLDTFVTLTADCDDKTLNAAFQKCAQFEKIFSRTIASSEVSRLNSAEDFTAVSKHTKRIIERGIYYGNLSGGRFDITICPVSMLWDFENSIVPDRNEIAEALRSVDYEQIEIDGERIFLNGAKLDLGGIAKGYIADEILEFFKAEKIKSGIINLGGNVIVFGEKSRNVAIKDPFGKKENIAVLSLKNKSVVTSGTYERCFEKDGENYHHILDSKNGYPVKSDLVSATVINQKSLDGDALSTVCILLGQQEAVKLIENTPDTEAVFVSQDGKLSYTSGIYEKKGKLYIG